MLQKLGVRADFVRIGAFKTAPEMFTRSGPTKAADFAHRDLLRQITDIYMNDVGGGRKIPLNELQKRISKGPFLAREAMNAHLVDGMAYDDELEKAIAEMFGHRVWVVEAKSSPTFTQRAPNIIGRAQHVAIVYVDGDMVDGRSRKIPLLGNKLVGSYTIVEALKSARENPLTKAIVLRVETPGGSSMAADVIWREVYLTAKVKPVIVSMGTSAASGGYYISAPATKIFANRSTITGSIGIFYGKADVQSLLNRIGVRMTTYRSTPRADAESIYRPFTEDEHQELGRKVKQFYDVFIDRVARGRKMSPTAVDRVARGRVWTGSQAVNRGLVDKIGGLREAIEEAERLGGLDPGSPIVELPLPKKTLLETVLTLAGFAQGSQKVTIPLPENLLRLGRAMAPLLVYSGDKPLARLETLFYSP
jgi:protease IV